MGVGEIAEWVILMLAPSAALLAMDRGPRACRSLGRRVRRGLDGRVNGRHDPSLVPVRPPIEELAADLRRLLQRHDALKRATDVAMRAQKMHALEAAISDCAVEAAAALDLPVPGRSGHAALPMPQLRRLVHSLSHAGLVLEPLTGAFRSDP